MTEPKTEPKTEIVCLSIEQTRKILAEHGFRITPQHLRAGIECGAYPFGIAIRMSKTCVYEVFRPLLMQWIADRSEVCVHEGAGS